VLTPVPGVSSFQVHISAHPITTPGDGPNVLVAMNPAALRADLARLEPGGTLIVNEDAFDERNLEKAGYHDGAGGIVNPLDDGSLAKWQLLKLNISQLTMDAVKPFGLGNKEAQNSHSFP